MLTIFLSVLALGESALIHFTNCLSVFCHFVKGYVQSRSRLVALLSIGHHFRVKASPTNDGFNQGWTNEWIPFSWAAQADGCYAASRIYRCCRFEGISVGRKIEVESVLNGSWCLSAALDSILRKHSTHLQHTRTFTLPGYWPAKTIITQDTRTPRLGNAK